MCHFQKILEVGDGKPYKKPFKKAENDDSYGPKIPVISTEITYSIYVYIYIFPFITSYS